MGHNSNDTRQPMPKGMETVSFVRQRDRNRKRAKLAKAARRKNRGK